MLALEIVGGLLGLAVLAIVAAFVVLFFFTDWSK